jgi:hypothetical protein
MYLVECETSQLELQLIGHVIRYGGRLIYPLSSILADGKQQLNTRTRVNEWTGTQTSYDPHLSKLERAHISKQKHWKGMGTEKKQGRAHRGARSSTDWARRAIVFIWTITFWLLIYRNKPLFLHLAYRFEPFQHPTISNQVFFLQIQKLRHDKPSLQLWRAGIHAWTFMLPCWLHWVDT